MLQTAFLNLSLPAAHVPHWVHFLKPCSTSHAQPAVHCCEALDSISGLSEHSFHSTYERFPRYKALLFSSSPATAETTVWFLDGTERTGGWLTLSKRLGERSCKTRPRNSACQQMWCWEISIQLGRSWMVWQFDLQLVPSWGSRKKNERKKLKETP